ncbi:hypothetical protein E2C01_000624 [Portunus trituberculatus]|uniref:Uncharacterized protein n=1 Tax=Portunus trituberculatus TaxID=210409 RepID=A0A5B7CK85_PORTR|nr:hypothetical protein [Portunus trituberculatus]
MIPTSQAPVSHSSPHAKEPSKPASVQTSSPHHLVTASPVSPSNTFPPQPHSNRRPPIRFSLLAFHHSITYSRRTPHPLHRRPTGNWGREGFDWTRYDGGSAASPSCTRLSAASLPTTCTLSGAPHYAHLPHPSRRPHPHTSALPWWPRYFIFVNLNGLSELGPSPAKAPQDACPRVRCGPRHKGHSLMIVFLVCGQPVLLCEPGQLAVPALHTDTHACPPYQPY